MTPRENLLGLYRKQGYENAPAGFDLCPALQQKYKAVAGDTPMAEHFDYPEGFATCGIPGLKLRPREPVNWASYFDAPLKEGTFFDTYGVAHEPGSEAAQHMRYMRHPLAKATSLEELQSYPFPEFDTDGVEHMRSAVEKIHEDGLAAYGGMEATIWETAWYIRDMTMLMMDMTMEDEKATFMLDKITEHACQRAEAFAAAGADIIGLGDDIGMQSTIMMSKEMYDAWLKPRLKTRTS